MNRSTLTVWLPSLSICCRIMGGRARSTLTLVFKFLCYAEARSHGCCACCCLGVPGCCSSSCCSHHSLDADDEHHCSCCAATSKRSSRPAAAALDWPLRPGRCSNATDGLTDPLLLRSAGPAAQLDGCSCPQFKAFGSRKKQALQCYTDFEACFLAQLLDA